MVKTAPQPPFRFSGMFYPSSDDSRQAGLDCWIVEVAVLTVRGEIGVIIAEDGLGFAGVRFEAGLGVVSLR